MENFLKKITEKVKKNWIIIIMPFIVLGSCWNPVKDVFKYSSQNDVKDFVKYMVKESLREDLERSATEYSVELLTLEMKNVRTPEKVDEIVKFWIDNKWNAQIAALKLVYFSKQAQNELKKQLYDIYIFRSLMDHAK